MTPLEQAITTAITQSPTIALLLWLYIQERKRADRADDRHEQAVNRHLDDLRVMTKNATIDHKTTEP